MDLAKQILKIQLLLVALLAGVSATGQFFTYAQYIGVPPTGAQPLAHVYFAANEILPQPHVLGAVADATVRQKVSPVKITQPISVTQPAPHVLGASSTLTDAQINAIISLLQSFGADSSVIESVRIDLNGEVATATSTQGVLTVVEDSAASLSYRLAYGGQTNVKLAQLKFHAANEAINLTDLALAFTNQASSSPADLVGNQVKLWKADGVTQVGTITFSNGTYSGVTNSIFGFQIPKDGDAVMIVTGDLSNIGISYPGGEGHSIAVDYDGAHAGGTRGVGLFSGLVIQSSSYSNSHVASVGMYKSVPRVMDVTVNSLLAPNSDLYKFTVSANPSSANGVYLHKVTFSIATSSTHVSGFRLYGPNGPINAVAINRTHPDNISSNGMQVLEIYADSNSPDRIIGAGQTKTYVLRADSVLYGSGTNSLTLRIIGDGEVPPTDMNTFMEPAWRVDQAAYDNFIWSPQATTTVTTSNNDFTNGHGVPVGIGMETLTNSMPARTFIYNNEVPNNADDEIPPTVLIASPPAWQTYSAGQTVLVEANASDNVGISKVEFSDGPVTYVDTVAPYQFSESITGSTPLGQHAWFATAYDNSGNHTTAGPRYFNVASAQSQQPPSILVTSPQDGSMILRSVPSTITWTSVNIAGPVTIDLWKNGFLYKTIAQNVSNTGSYTWTPNQVVASTVTGTTNKFQVIVRGTSSDGNSVVSGIGYFFYIVAQLSFDYSPPQVLGASSSLSDSQIQAILSLLQSFGADSTVITNVQKALNGEGGSSDSGTPWCHTFNANLRIGSGGDEVAALQKVLFTEGFDAGSSGKNAGIYDDAVASAVSGFQQKYANEILTPNGLQYGTGFVGAATRKKLNQLYGCGAYPTPKPEPIPMPPTSASIKVLSPNGGEKIVLGKPYIISWEGIRTSFPQDNLSVYLSLQKPGDAPFVPGSGGVLVGGTSSLIERGSFVWMAGTYAGGGNLGTVTAPAGPGYKIVATIWSFTQSKVLAQDISDLPFNLVDEGIPPVVSRTADILTPNGGESWKLGDHQIITWKQNTTASSFNIGLVSLDGQRTWHIARYIAPNITSYDWVVGTINCEPSYGTCAGLQPTESKTQVPPGTYYMRIVTYGSPSSVVNSDDSDVPFTITSSSSSTPLLPDFIVTDAHITPSTPALGQNAEFIFTVKNIGQASGKFTWYTTHPTSNFIGPTNGQSTLTQNGCLSSLPLDAGASCTIRYSVSFLKAVPSQIFVNLSVSTGYQESQVANNTALVKFNVAEPSVTASLDIDGNGSEDGYDSNLLADIIMGNAACPAGHSCDVNGDGKVDAADLLKYYFVNTPYDLNGDGAVTSADNEILVAVIRGAATCPAGKTCDTNGDHVINAYDLSALNKDVSGLACVAPSNLSPSGTITPTADGKINLTWSPAAGAAYYAVRLDDGTSDRYNDSRYQSCMPGGSPHYYCENGIVGTSVTGVPVKAGRTYKYWVDAIFYPQRFGDACRGTTNITVQANVEPATLKIGLVSQPTATLAPQGTIVPFTNFVLSPSKPVVLKSLLVQRNGLSSDTAFKNVVLISNSSDPISSKINSGQIVAYGWLDSSHAVTLVPTTPLTLDSVTNFTIAGVMAADNQANAGQVGYFTIVGGTYLDSSSQTLYPIQGSYPLTGVGQTINSSLSVGSFYTEALDSGAILRITASNVEPLSLRSVVLASSAPSVEVNGATSDCKKLADTTNRIFCKFSLITIAKGSSVDIKIPQGYSASLASPFALEAYGQTYGYRADYGTSANANVGGQVQGAYVETPLTASLTASRPDLGIVNSSDFAALPAAGSVTLSWSAPEASQCTISNTNFGALGNSGSMQSEIIRSNTQFTLSCIDGDRTAQDSVLVSVSN